MVYTYDVDGSYKYKQMTTLQFLIIFIFDFI